MIGIVVRRRRFAAFGSPARSRGRGVSLLEMLVALTILAVAGAALFGWVYQVSSQLQRLNARQQQSMAKLTALQFLKTINPAATASGTQQFTDFVLRWDAVASAPMRTVLTPNDAPRNVQIGVFNVAVTLLRQGEPQAWLSFQTQLPGWNNLRGGPQSPVDVGIAGGVLK